MNNILQIGYYLFIIFFTFLIGFSVVLLSKTRQENWMPKSVLYGAALLVICSYWMSFFSASGLNGISRIAVAVLTIYTIFIYIVKKKRLVEYMKSLSKSDIRNIVVCCMLGFIPLVMIVIWGAQYPYCDGYTYICNADYLVDHGYRVMVNQNDTITHPWLSQTLLYQMEHFRIGAQMFLAFFSAFFNVEFSIELFLPITAYGVFLCGLSSWVFIGKRYSINKYVKILAIIVMAGNVPIVLWSALYGFLPQIFGSAFCLAALAGIMEFAEWKNSKLWYVFVTAMLFSSEALAYNEMLPFLVLSTFFVILRYLLKNKEESRQIILLMMGCATIAILLIITYVPGMIQAMLTMFGGVVGWHQDNDINTYIGYMLSSVPAEYSFRTAQYGLELFLLEILTLIIGIFVLFGFYKTSKTVKIDFLTVSLPYLLMLFYFVFFTENPFVGGMGNSWSIYKLMQYYFIVAAPYIAIFIGESISKINKRLGVLLVLIYMGYNVNNAIDYAETLSQNMENYVGEEKNSIEEYYSLYEQYKDTQDIITLYNVPQKHRQMITYFLKDVKLVSDWNSDGYYANIPEVPKELYGGGINLTYDLTDNDNIAGMVEKDAEITLEEGFYGKESAEESYWNWSKKESSLSINKYAVDKEFQICFEVFGNNSQEREWLLISAQDGEVLKRVEIIPGVYTNVSIDISANIDKICFEYSGENEGSENDPREIAFAIANYYICEK